MRLFFIINLLLVISLSVFSTSSFSQEKQLTAKRKQTLIHILKQDCGSCHGMTLKGGLGSPLLPKNLKKQTPQMIENTILYGRPGTAMPPWNTLLTKQEIHWLALQLKKGI